MTFMDTVERTRSFRRFKEEREIGSEVLREVVRAASLAPSAANLQRLRFSIVTDAAERDAIFSGIGWAGYLEDWDGPEPGRRPSAYIVVHSPLEERKFDGIDIGIAASYIVLAASERSIGSCMILSFDREKVNSVAPAEGYRTALLIALGYPGETIVLEKDMEEVRYWRDRKGVHHVPKRSLDSLILKS